MDQLIRDKIQQTARNLQVLVLNDEVLGKIADTARAIVNAIKEHNKLMICGNGGSAADAQHMAGEFLCRFYRDRDPLPAIALTTDTSVITSISNDYSYADSFARQVRALGKKGDVLLGISTSGTSRNVQEAFKAARSIGMVTILLTGEAGKAVDGTSDIVVRVPSADTPRIQEMHLVVEHIVCEIVEKELFKSR